jgi:acetyl-CoA C-acetyltransferase
MGVIADSLAVSSHISRDSQDAYVSESFHRAVAGWETGQLDVFPYNGVDCDELLGKLIPDKIPTLSPCFSPSGVITAASSAALADGAAALLVGSEQFVEEGGVRPIARVLAYGEAGSDPDVFTTSLVSAVNVALSKAGLGINEVDLWEIYEAFAMVPLLVMRELGLDADRVNVLGGAVAIGNAVGCSGVMIVNSLLSALKIRGKKIGVAAMCNGGGGGSAIVIELL